MAADLKSRWAARRWPQTMLVWAGAILVLSGAFHLVVFLVSGTSWDGPVSWRKPTLFGLSFGVTLLAVAWIMSYLPGQRRLGGLLAVALAGSSLAEVFLIDMQRWRGVPSHFNFGTLFDSLVFSVGMAGFVAITATALVILTVWAFVSAEGPPSTLLAIRAGLTMLLIAQALGGAIVGAGNSQVNTISGFDPHTVRVFGPNGVIFGAAGIMKVPHGVALHGIQLLLGLAWLAGLARSSEATRVRIVAAGTLGYAGILAVSAYQTFSGRAPLALVPWASVILWLSMFLLLGALVAVVGMLLQSRARSVPA
jgi:hypothetical protein